MHAHPNGQLHCRWITSLIIVPQKTKSMDLCLWWLCCQESQQHFRYYWDKGSHNGQTTTPSITHQSTMKPTDPSMLMQ
jgi:hypothetical protein